MNIKSINARTVAGAMIEQFINNKSTDLTTTDEAAHLTAMAKTLARNTAALVVHHSRRHRADPAYKVPGPIWPLVNRYEQARRQK